VNGQESQRPIVASTANCWPEYRPTHELSALVDLHCDEKTEPAHREALEHIGRQLTGETEVVVVDGASTDDTAEIVEANASASLKSAIVPVLELRNRRRFRQGSRTCRRRILLADVR